MTRLPVLGFIGAGRAAHIIAPALEAAGCRVAVVASRNDASATRLAKSLNECKTGTLQETADSAEMVFITTPDDVIPQVVRAVEWRPGQAVVHCSGASTLEPLEAARTAGADVGSWHPVQTFTASSGLEVLQDTTIGVEASGALLATLIDLARRVGGLPLDVPPSARPLYHAAAVMACGYIATLLHEAESLWDAAGLPREAAHQALGKLAETTVANARRDGPRAALTGPAARGDVATVRAHLNSLAAAAPDTLSVYRALARRSIAIVGGAAEWDLVLIAPEEV